MAIMIRSKKAFKRIKRLFEQINYRKLLKISFVACITLLVLTFAINTHILSQTKNLIFTDIERVEEKQTVLVLGAYVNPDGSLSYILKDRVDSAYELYEKDKVSKFLLSGDHGQDEYDEVNHMRKYLLSKGVLAEDIFLDHAGFDTYNSVYRAKEIFEVESLIIVTQRFHLPRALYIAQSLGIDAIGFEADKRPYRDTKILNIREIPARIKAYANINFKIKPIYLGDQIPITGDSKLSWDEDQL
jgi:SanA protein